MKKAVSILLAAILLATLLCGCGGGSSVKTESSYARADAPKAATPNSSGGTMFAADSGAGWTAQEEKSDAPMEPAETGSNLPENTKLIYRASIDMESTEFDAARQGLEALVAQLGGYFENSELNNYANYRRAWFTVRLPAANFETFCSAVGEICQVNNLSRSAEDVSEFYYDTESRLVTQQTKLARLQDLLRQAEDMKDIITLESAISETELAIEQLTGTLRKYDSLVSYATVTITLSEVYQLTAVEEPVIGFGAKLAQAFRSGAQGFVNGLQRFLLSVARGWIGWLVFLIIVAAVILIVRKITKRRRARYAAAPQQPPRPPQNPQPPQPPQNPQPPQAPQQ